MKCENLDRCVVLAEENKGRFEVLMEQHLEVGYKVEASSCNSREYKAILILPEENIGIDKDEYERLVRRDTSKDVVIDEEGYITCPSCGSTIDKHDFYCYKCGQALGWVAYYKEKIDD